MFFSFKSYAKLNLFLSVKGIESNGYHKVSTLMSYVNIFDNISIETRPHGYGLKITFCGKYGHKLAKSVGNKIKDNLIAKTFALISKKYGVQVDLSVKLEKNIPLLSGMGGGSSNSGKIIDFCDHFYGLEMTQEDKISIAKELGSDVSFFTQNQSAICSGLGEKIDQVEIDKNMENYSVLLIEGGQKASTKNIYQDYDLMKLTKEQEDSINQANDMSCLNLHTMTKLGIKADLFAEIISEQNANTLVFESKYQMTVSKQILNFAKNISDKNEIVNCGITGAGPTIYIIYKNQLEARSVMTKLQNKFPCMWMQITNLMQSVELESKILQIGRYLLKCNGDYE